MFWVGSTLNLIQSPTSAMGRDTQGAPNPIQPGFEHCQGRGSLCQGSPPSQRGVCPQYLTHPPVKAASHPLVNSDIQH